MKLESYVCGAWTAGSADGVEVRDAVTSEPVCRVDSSGIDFAAVLHHGRTAGGPALRALTIHERGLRLKALATYLLERKEEFYRVSDWTGATRSDSWIDIEGGIATLFSYSGIARREFDNQPFSVEGPPERLSANGSFVGRHVLVPREGVSVHINAFNFPCWGMLEKIAPSLVAGMPVLVKPATVSAYLTEAMVRAIIASEIFPEGSIQLICGGVGDLLEHLDAQDAVTFTGSASTGRKLRTHSNIIEHSIPFNLETDSLNCSILGESATPGTPEFDLFVREVGREMCVKAGQKCTAIRRAIVPRQHEEAVIEALRRRLSSIVLGDPEQKEVNMGPLVGTEQREEVWRNLESLQRHCTVLHGGSRDFEVRGADAQRGAFFPPTLLHCDQPLQVKEPHEIEAFGPVSTLLPYRDKGEAIELARRGRGSLVGSLFSAEDQEAAELCLGSSAYHGRLLIINRDCAAESTGHGSPLPTLVHGGPGRAGGGEELGGARAVKHYMRRVALQGSPSTLSTVTREYHPGGKPLGNAVHPFRKYFEELQIGETLITHRRTVTEADIISFAGISGDRFYAHCDELGARDSLFGQRVAHGYFVIAAAAGMFVDPGPNPVLANYGLDNLRFLEPVLIGDTIRVRLTAKRKIAKRQRNAEERPNGIVVWDVEITNQNNKTVALYDVLTLVARKKGDAQLSTPATAERR